MAVSVDHNQAREILHLALSSKCKLNDSTSALISEILNGSHVTFRYILLTGLLAKSTNESVNPITLQAGSELEGAYDARSLCHKVIVPFERTHLFGSLGASNEPFLNKPARFPELSINNPVRAGKDKLTLAKLIRVLSSMDSSEKAFSYLICGLNSLEEVIERNRNLDNSAISTKPELVDIFNFLVHLVSKSFEGETMVIAISALEELFYSRFVGEFEVIAHKVNQSGASSNEVGDIDIYLDGNYEYSIEVKDKIFSDYDVDHAFAKIMKSGGSKGIFIHGSKASFNFARVKKVMDKYLGKGFLCQIRGFESYIKHLIIKMENLKAEELISAVIEKSNQVNARLPTKEWIQEVIESYGWRK